MSKPTRIPPVVHVHFLVDHLNKSYEWVYNKYGDYIDPETKMMNTDTLTDLTLKQ